MKYLVLMRVDIVENVLPESAENLIKEYVRGADFTYQNEAWHTSVKNPEVISVEKLITEDENESNS